MPGRLGQQSSKSGFVKIVAKRVGPERGHVLDEHGIAHEPQCEPFFRALLGEVEPSPVGKPDPEGERPFTRPQPSGWHGFTPMQPTRPRKVRHQPQAARIGAEVLPPPLRPHDRAAHERFERRVVGLQGRQRTQLDTLDLRATRSFRNEKSERLDFGQLRHRSIAPLLTPAVTETAQAPFRAS